MIERNLLNHNLYTFSSAYMLPTPLAELLNDVDGQTTVLVTGVFDVLHQEHIHFLTNAKEAGDVLIVAIESDTRVRQIKGSGRPHFSQQQRRAHLLELELADSVVILPESFSDPEEHTAVISQIRPTYLAVSSHTKHLDKKEHILAKDGGTVLVVHTFNPTESTSLLLDKN